MIKTLKYIAEQYGNEILKEGSKLIAYYTDLEPRQKTERQMLEILIKCNGNIKLLNVCQEPQQEQQACVESLVKQLTSQLLMSEEAAYAVCDNFLQAIGGAPILKPKVSQQKNPEKRVTTPIAKTNPLDSQHTDVQPCTATQKTQRSFRKIILPVVLVMCFLSALVVGILLGDNNTKARDNVNETVSARDDNEEPITPNTTILGGEGAIISYMKVLLDNQNATSYSVYDINADGLKELIVQSGGKYNFYTYHNGYVGNLGTLDARNSMLLHSGGYLTLLSQQDGKSKFSLIRMNGNAISSEVLSQIDTPENSDFYHNEYEVLEMMPSDKDNPWGTSFHLLNDVFSGGVSSAAKQADFFLETDSGFSNNCTTVASLPNGWVAVIDAENMVVTSSFHISGEEVNIVGSTNETIFIKSVDQYIDDGRFVLTVSAYDYNGTPGTKWDGYNKVWFEAGHLIMQYTREYIYPSETCIISPENQVVFEGGAIWTIDSYNGEIYFLAPPDYFCDDMSRIDIYRLNAGETEFCGSIDTEFDGYGQLIPSFLDGTIVLEKITLDDSSENWEDWIEIVTKSTYSLDGEIIE